MSHPRHVLAIDQGTTSTRSIVFDERGRAVALARRELAQHYPAPGWVEHDAEDIWRDTLATARECHRPERLGARRHRRDRHHQPARNGGRVGPRERRADPSRDRLAGPPHGAGVRQASQRRRRGSRAPAHGTAARSVLLGHQDPLDPRRGRGRARACRARRARLRHDRLLPALAPDGRPRSRDRRDECLAHDAVRHSPRRVGRRPAAPARRAARADAAGEETAATISARPRPGSWGAASRSAASRATSRRRWSARPASSREWRSPPTGPGVSCCSIPASTPVHVAEPHADDARVSHPGPHDLCDGGLHLRRRCRRQVAAGRARAHRRRGRDRGTRDAGTGQPRRLHGARIRRPRRAALGAGRARAALRAHARCRQGASRPRGAGVRRLPDPGPDFGHDRRRGAHRSSDPRRRRHGRQRLVLPVPGGCGRCARRAAGRAGNHRARRRFPRRARDRRLAGPEGRREHLRDGKRIQACDAGGTPQELLAGWRTALRRTRLA